MYVVVNDTCFIIIFCLEWTFFFLASAICKYASHHLISMKFLSFIHLLYPFLNKWSSLGTKKISFHPLFHKIYFTKKKRRRFYLCCILTMCVGCALWNPKKCTHKKATKNAKSLEMHNLWIFFFTFWGRKKLKEKCSELYAFR